MAYEVLARKWRPQLFEDVLGQEHVTRTLVNAIESRRIAHAYLFVGPRGIGKTTLSRIFAKALNCSAGPDPTAHPCGKCDNCREIMAGSSLDVVEIDAASNNSVNDIRDLRETVQFTPAASRYKVFIIDEVHMLSAGAFNALLKTLEEPPPHVKFIFATTEFDKLPSTIVSRCQRFDLRRIPTALIVKNLSGICASEGVKASEDALLAVARGADGGMRDALSALDQLISFKGGDIEESDVVSIFGLVSRQQIAGLTTAVLKGDMAAGLEIIDSLDKAGKDLRRLVVEMLEHFRNVMVRQRLGAAALPLLDVTPDQLRTIDEQAGLADTARILRVAELFGDLENRIRFALSRRVIFETVFLRACRAATTVTLDQVIRQLSGAAANLPQGPDAQGRKGLAPSCQAAPAPSPAPQLEQGGPSGRPGSPQPGPHSAPAPNMTQGPAHSAGSHASAPNMTQGPQGLAQSARPAAPKRGASDLKAALYGGLPPPQNPPPQPAPAAPAAEDDGQSPIRAANEPAIKTAIKLFNATITSISPASKAAPETIPDAADTDDADTDAAIPEDDIPFDDPPND